MKHRKNHYRLLKIKLFFRLACLGILAFILIVLAYKLFWSHRGSKWMVAIFERFFNIDYDTALHIYWYLIRNHVDMISVVAIIVMCLILIFLFLGWFTRYFDMINRGISSVLEEDATISLPAELAVTERKLYELKAELKQHALAAQLAEQRKDELVMYLAHDIRTPLTSVIGYLNLLAEAPDLPEEQRAKYIDITLDKAYRLEKMINEFFEITRYNLQQISITKETVDLYYMLVQITDELSPVLSENGNTTVLNADENITVSGDPDKLARVFRNILKNAAIYSFPNTEIVISAEENENAVTLSFQNQGTTIPEEKLSFLFEKFYRLDEARNSKTGGTGLGLAIAKDIVSLHGGTIRAESRNDTVVFTVVLPK